MKRLCTLLAAALTAAGCMPDASDSEVLTAMADTDPMGWSLPVATEIENRDTVSMRELSIAVRYGIDTDVDDLSLSLTFTAPDSTVFTERAVFPLAHRRKAASVAAVETIPYRQNVRLAQTGVYRVEIMPAGRVRGFEAAGIVVAKSQQ